VGVHMSFKLFFVYDRFRMTQLIMPNKKFIFVCKLLVYNDMRFNFTNTRIFDSCNAQVIL